MSKLLLLLISSFVGATLAAPSYSYLAERQSLIQEEKKLQFGHDIVLSDAEARANLCLMRAKTEEINNGLRHPDEFLPAQNFLRARESIEESKVFRLLQRMPKGGLFHAHSTALRSVDELMKYLDDPDLYICFRANDKIVFRFAAAAPEDTAQCAGWQLLRGLRRRNKYIDEEIRDQLLLDIDESTDINAVWDSFENVFDVISGIVKFRPIFEKYLYESMQELYDDGVMFMEIRTPFSALYDLNGNEYSPLQVAEIMQEVSKRFCASHTEFLGIKTIFSVFRGKSLEQVERAIDTYHEVKTKYPDFVLGFDLIGQEDKFNPLMFYSSQLQKLGESTQFFFHAGETNWYGQDSDYNLVDAILLNTKRIGHGYALIKHPKLMEIVKRKKIAIELNPISNQVLKLVADMRNHPASYLFAEDFAVVVSSDDPSIWGAKGLSYDFYEAFVGIMSSEADLRALKKLALNSITYSGLNEAEQLRALDIFAAQWSRFVAELPESPVCRRLQTSRA
ncbi:adenosine deaminase 2-like [Trichogramma pretiosum]|uniref:adenosine deaminase 2-like n=1 Tax=Trichogramma pretiosum TaxID=7493 RepID=UPI000C718FF6|nr:adenosine deaminase 2-like [Trichogramma pretiosum]